jgi:hypothetical protein
VQLTAGLPLRPVDAGVATAGVGFPARAQVVVNNPSPGIIELRVCAPVPLDASYFHHLQQLNAVLNENSPTSRIARPL